MPIVKDGTGTIQYTPPANRYQSTQTGVFVDSDFTLAHPSNVLKQIQFLVNPTTPTPGVLTIQCDIDTNTVLNLTNLVSPANSFSIMQPVTGTSPTASTLTDTLTFANTDGHITIAGSSAAKSLTFGMANMYGTIGTVMDGGGITLTTGFKGYIQVPFSCTVVAWTILADQSGSATIDITKDVIGNYPPTTSITASAKPTLTSATESTGSALTGWTTIIAADSIIGFNLTAVTSCTKITISMKVLRT